jgi:hypothetical protein
MTENKTKHFEDLWNESEQLVSKLHKDTSTEDLIKLITNLLVDYKDMSTSTIIPDEVKKSLKNRYMGEIVFLLTCVSLRDNINVYASLMEELRLNESK